MRRVIFLGAGTDTPRNDDHMEVSSTHARHPKKKLAQLGINVGDCVAFDPRVEVTNGFIRSRFLDDKACVANLVAAIKSMAESGRSPKRSVYFHISNYEEVGHGASAGIPSDVAELVTVDMAVVGAGQESDEFSATLCIKDSGGPYHEGLNKKMRALAEKHGIRTRPMCIRFTARTAKPSGAQAAMWRWR
jgi:putative aminopeptidase FrvX